MTQNYRDKRCSLKCQEGRTCFFSLLRRRRGTTEVVDEEDIIRLNKKQKCKTKIQYRSCPIDINETADIFCTLSVNNYYSVFLDGDGHAGLDVIQKFLAETVDNGHVDVLDPNAGKDRSRSRK